VASKLERRSGRRFPIRMHVAYRLVLKEDKRVLSQGKGQTVDISHTGILLSTADPYPVGAAAELLVDWPAHAEDKAPVQLWLVGRVVRSDEHGTAVQILRHSFRAREEATLSTSASWAGLPSDLTPDPIEK